ncbi:MAG: cation-efflux pump [Thermoproteota archaeon]
MTQTDLDDQDKRDSKKGREAAVVAMVVNAFISTVKLVAGIIFGSVAIFADGVDSFFDIVSSVSVLAGMKASEKPPDDEHLYGHGRFENLPSLVIAWCLIIAAVGILYEALKRIVYSEYNIFEWAVLGAALFSVGGKYLLQKYLFEVNEKISSTTIKSYAQNIRGDVLTSVSVAVGVTVAALGIPWVDPLVAILVAALILKTGIEVALETLYILSDTSPGAETISKIRSIALTIPGVKDCHRVRARRSGRKIFVDLHILVDPGIEVVTSHNISDKVVEAILKSFTDVENVLVHVEPSPQKEDIENHSREIDAIISEVAKIEQVVGCHGVKLQHVGDGLIAEMHILVDPKLNITETHRISEEVSAKVRARFPKIKQVLIHEEPESVDSTET